MKQVTKQLYRFNKTFYYTDNLYRLISKKLDIPYSHYLILYLVRSETCLPYCQKIVEETGEPKQTINSSLKKLEKEGIIELVKENKLKRICLTSNGIKYCEKTIDKIIDAEIDAFNTFNKKDIEQYLEINEQLACKLEKEFNKIDG